jgi:uncharacterized protein YdeI (YjbR/CyaY-like superfamily)
MHFQGRLSYISRILHGRSILKIFTDSLSSPFSAAMSSTTPRNEFSQYTFTSTANFEAFLEKQHATAPGIYLKLAKKGSGIPSITAAEAVEVALCFGWIDGRANSIDAEWWTVRYTPRRAKSIWSKKNVYTVARLIEEGKMRPAGLACVEAAKADGRWERAYGDSGKNSVPQDFVTALAANPIAKSYFDGLNKDKRYSVLSKLATAVVGHRATTVDTLVRGLATNGLNATGMPQKQLTGTKIRTSSIKKAPPTKRLAGATTAAPKPAQKANSRASAAASASTEEAKKEQPLRPRREGLRQRN